MALKGTLTSTFYALQKSEELIIEVLAWCTFVCGRIEKEANKIRDWGLCPTPILKIRHSKRQHLSHTAIVYQSYFQNMLQIKGSSWLYMGCIFAVKGSHHTFNHPATFFLPVTCAALTRVDLITRRKVQCGKHHCLQRSQMRWFIL